MSVDYSLLCGLEPGGGGQKDKGVDVVNDFQPIANIARFPSR
jgi:hypothetical protein